MKIKSFIPLALLLTIGMVSITGCQKGDLIDNPNVAASSGTVPASLLLNHLTATLIKSDEQPFSISSKNEQYVLSNYAYYWGVNTYGFSNTEDSYNVLKYAIALQAQSTAQQGNTTNKYYAIAQFFKAYAGIWLTQRVGDIPFSQAGNPAILTPVYDKQHDVYKACLALLDNANTIMTPLVAANGSKAFDTGDIFGLTYLQWQKVINTYRLRVLISLSKRAVDNPDLNIPQQFNTIVSNPTTYPIMTSNADNVVYKYNQAFNPYAILNLGLQPYDNFGSMGLPYVTVTSTTQDPRLMVVATPAPQQITAGKSVSDFTAWVGADDNVSIATLNTNAAAGQYSYLNYNRYFSLPGAYSGANAEPFVFIGYPEMCFNIAEAINLGWVTGSSSTTYYNNGINASLGIYNITNGETLTIADLKGNTLGTTTVNLPQFMSNVAYAGDNANGLVQIFTQRYVAMFCNSGWESYYQWRRSVSTTYPNGIPTWSQGDAGSIGTASGAIPRRFLYPAAEATSNTANYNAALISQFGSAVDAVNNDTWLTK
jgi:hypothetical protein